MVNVHRGNRKFYTVNGTIFIMKLNEKAGISAYWIKRAKKKNLLLSKDFWLIVENDQDFDDDKLLIDHFPW